MLSILPQTPPHSVCLIHSLLKYVPPGAKTPVPLLLCIPLCSQPWGRPGQGGCLSQDQTLCTGWRQPSGTVAFQKVRILCHARSPPAPPFLANAFALGLKHCTLDMANPGGFMKQLLQSWSCCVCGLCVCGCLCVHVGWMRCLSVCLPICVEWVGCLCVKCKVGTYQKWKRQELGRFCQP